MTYRIARINKFVPDMLGTLSQDIQDQISAMHKEGKLSPFACSNEDAIRRDDRDHDRDTVLRPAFVRDVEKIIHMPAYNRLAGKTQVFSFHADDDLARRGLHEQLVCRVARDIGRGLGLNQDLIEAIALGHDIGHTPFGHAGERFLNNIFHRRTSRWFFHNVQSVRVLDILGGRNLTLQTLDGVICHNGEFEQQRFVMSGLSGFDEFDRIVEGCWKTGDDAIGHLRPMTLEGCVVRISDIIAYVGKDRQDALRAHLVNEDSFDDGLGGEYNSWALAAFVADVVEHSFGKDHIEMSEEGFHELARAKRENYKKIYGTREVSGDFSAPMQDFFERLYDHELAALKSGDESAAIFAHHIEPITRHLTPYGRSYSWQDDLDLTVVDFISSMTDDYFMASCEELFADAKDFFPKRGYFRNVHA